MSAGANGRLPITKLYEWLGERAVLLPLPFGKKKPVRSNWRSTTFEDTQEADYQKELQAAIDREGNIGVLLRDGLAAIDIDVDQFVDVVLALNPALAKTLRSRGARGCQFWLRMVGDYPRKVYKLKKADGTVFGEWRGGGGSQSVIAGQHPNGTPDKPVRYVRIVAKPAVAIAFSKIVWPSDVVLPWKVKEPRRAATQATDMDKRISAYIAAIPGAVAGQCGHDKTSAVACALINGWGISADQALSYLKVYNQRCEPPWNDKELIHKIESAENAPRDKPRGHLLGPLEPEHISGAVNGTVNNEQEDKGIAGALDEHATETQLARVLESKLPPLWCVGEDWLVYQSGVWSKTSRNEFKPLALSIQDPRTRSARKALEVLKHVEFASQINGGEFRSFYANARAAQRERRGHYLRRDRRGFGGVGSVRSERFYLSQGVL